MLKLQFDIMWSTLQNISKLHCQRVLCWCPLLHLFFTSGLSGNMPITFLHIICITNCLIVMLGAIWLCILCSIGQSRAYYMPPLDFRIKISEAQIWMKDRNGIILLSIVEIILRLTSFLTKIFNRKFTLARVFMKGWLKSFIQIPTYLSKMIYL